MDPKTGVAEQLKPLPRESQDSHQKLDPHLQSLQSSQSSPYSPPPTTHSLSCRISSISELSDFSHFQPYDHDPGRAQPPPSSHDPDRRFLPNSSSPDTSTSTSTPRLPTIPDAAQTSPPSVLPTWTSQFSTAAIMGGYAQVPLSEGGGPALKTLSSGTRRLSRAGFSSWRRPGPITDERGGQGNRRHGDQHHGDGHGEEEIGLSLMRAPAPMGVGSGYPPTAYESPGRMASVDRQPPDGIGVDLTNALGPMTSPHEDGFMRAIWAQKAGPQTSGETLARGLGTGIKLKPGATIRSRELLSRRRSILDRALSRSSLAHRRPSAVGRAQAIKGLGQQEADKRGEIIEVVMEAGDHDDHHNDHHNDHHDDHHNNYNDCSLGPDASHVDLSFVAGSAMHRPTYRTRPQRSQIFYPKPNWKPASMRAPYLTFMIATSVVLAVSQEVLFQRFHDNAMFTFRTPDDLPPASYFAVKFLPTIVSVAYGVMWQAIDFEVKRLEAFHQLSREGGAVACASINVDYTTGFNVLRPLLALRLRHYAVAVSSVASTVAVSLVPTFSAAAIFLSPDRQERLADPDGIKTIHVRATWSRLLTATLLLCAVLGCVLLCLLQRRRSGLLADVRGIAGLASMAVASHILTDFRDTDTAKHQDIHHRLKHRRYILRNMSLAPYDDDDDDDDDDNDNDDNDDDNNNGNDNEGGRDQKIKRDRKRDRHRGRRDRDRRNRDSKRERERERREKSPVPTGAHLSENPHPLILRPAGSIPFIVGIGLFLGFIPVFLFSPATVIADEAPWVMTALAVCIKLSWNGLETAVRMMEPYYILSRRHAPSRTLTLDYTALPFGYLPVRAFLNRHFLMFSVGFGTVMTEVLTILVTSLSTIEGRHFIGLAVKGGLGGGLGRDDGDDNNNNNNNNNNNIDMINNEDGNNDDDGDDEEKKTVNSGQETVTSFLVTFALATFILLYLFVVATTVFVRRRHPFLPRQPNTTASVLAFIHQSRMLYDFVDTARLSNAGMVRHLAAKGKTYGLGWYQGRDGQMHCGVDEEELMNTYQHGIDFSQGNMPWNTRWDVL